MNIHVVLDDITSSIGSLLAGKKKFFSADLESRPFKELIQSIEADLPSINSTGTYEIGAKSQYIQLDTAVKIDKWMGYENPTIVYHHGNNERPFSYKARAKNSFFNVFAKSRDRFKANLIVVRAPFHDCSLKQYQEKMACLSHFMLMIATSVKINEMIVRELKTNSASPVITCGMSLGGWVTNLHRTYFNSSDAYIPLLAGTFLGELFLHSSYRKLVGSNALLEPGTIRKYLNFNSEFDKIKEKNVFPILALYDRFIEYDIQKKSYEGHDIKTIEAGHVTGSLNSNVFRAHCLEILNESSNKKNTEKDNASFK
jgi:hypothetical protein